MTLSMPIKVTKIESVYFQFVQVWTVKGTLIVLGADNSSSFFCENTLRILVTFKTDKGHCFVPWALLILVEVIKLSCYKMIS